MSGHNGKVYVLCIFSLSLSHTVTAVVPSFLADPHHVDGDDEVHVIKDDGELLLSEPFLVAAV